MKIIYFGEEYRDYVANIARRINADLVDGTEIQVPEHELYLRYDSTGLSLVNDSLEMKGDFTQLRNRILQKNLEHEMIVRAVRIKDAGKTIKVLDATAGMGEDSFILAAAGFDVVLYEYDGVIAALLEDALLRASDEDDLGPIVQRMTVHNGDSIEAMKKLHGDADVIFLDPMFPKRTKSAMIGKKFQLLQQLEAPCTDENELMMAAIGACPQKIVVKRPTKGQTLAGIKPDFSYEGKAVRYDCLINIEAKLNKIRKQ